MLHIFYCYTALASLLSYDHVLVFIACSYRKETVRRDAFDATPPTDFNILFLVRSECT